MTGCMILVCGFSLVTCNTVCSCLLRVMRLCDLSDNDLHELHFSGSFFVCFE